jgi:UPF0755 protein
VERPHSSGNASEVQTKQARYKEIERHIAEPHGPSATSRVPTRDDAVKKVGQQKELKKQKEQASGKVVATVAKDGSVKPKKITSSPAKSKSTVRTKQTETPKKSKKPHKKNQKPKTSSIQLPVKTFVALVLVIAVLLGSFIAQTYLANRKSQTSQISDTLYVVTIQPGMNAHQIARSLQLAKVVSSARDFERFVRANGYDTRLKSGTFDFKGPREFEDIVNMLVAKQTDVRNVKVYDGYTIAEIDSLVAKMKLADEHEFVEAAEHIASASRLPFAEGWFLSGDYSVSTSQPAMELAQKMHSALLSVLQAHAAAIENLDRPLIDIIRVASLVQRETQNPEEMPHIAAIIYKRLDANWKLGIDASLRYALNRFSDVLSEADFQSNSPFNTRKFEGLPPSGIGSVGIQALLSALYPAENDWWFYLHDSDKRIRYASTLPEHELNRARYLQ